MKKRNFKILGLAVLALIVCGCAHNGSRTAPVPENPAAAVKTEPSVNVAEPAVDPEFADEDLTPDLDPLAFWNVTMFHFNDTIYYGVMKPLSSAFRALVPKTVRIGIKNFFYNIAGPARMVNCIIQGKGGAAQAEFVRFCMNTTVGVLGFGNPAGKFEQLNPPEEDFGQSFGVYGFGEGFFIVWPVLGPSSLRDTIGMVGDKLLNPVTYIDPTEVSMAISGLETVNNASFRIGDYEAIKEAAVDPYEAFHDAYRQYRQKQIRE